MPIDVDELKLLHADGWSDADMAVRFDVTAPTVKRWRETLRLKRNAQRRIWTEDEVARIRTLAAQGKSYVAIGAAIGASADVIGGICRKHGIRPQPKYLKVSAQIYNRIEAMVREGLGPTAIASEVGLSPKAVSNRITYMRRCGRLPPAEVPHGARASVPQPVRDAGIEQAVRMRAVSEPGRGGGRHSRDGLIARLAHRHGEALVQEVSRIPPRKGAYRKLCAVADCHGISIKAVETVWHQVRA
ncbi:hypothetical protein KZZ07_26385 [Mameliella sp. CS4]|uniref:hypothetical protein n=1 Tax=Mameliella sp. CS4 TaxID=2862329 RepID=UPI001C5DA770|nr:hypothetical protein [Mameliella sp. CS4]MBW4986059.1 hypothetical protein [Mameliella sp. CS4]